MTTKMKTGTDHNYCAQTLNTNAMKFVNSIKSTAGYTCCLMLLFFCFSSLQAEGIQQAAPNSSDSPVMLEAGRPDFGNFAVYDGPINSRLQFSIGSPDEIFYIGLSVEHDNDGNEFPGSFPGQYSFRIKNAAGTVVHGPFIITNNNANVGSYADAAFGNYDVTATQGGDLMYQFQPSALGDYYIEFQDATFPDANGTKVNIAYWDFTVTDSENNPIPGRVWSKTWAFRTPAIDGTSPPDCGWDRPFNGTLYSYTTDGFVSKIDFEDSGFQGLSFNVTFNSSGPGVSDDLIEDRKSIPGANATLNSGEHKIFLNAPDVNLFPDGICGEIITPGSFSCLNQDSFCLAVSVTKPGQVEVILDFNQNGVLDPESEDVTLVYEFPEGDLSGCIPWNGLSGTGNPVSVGDTIDLIFFYSQGVQHWSAYDAEFLRNGYCIETIRPICEPNLTSNLLFWDDRNIPEDPGNGADKDGRNGCSCDTGCRTWTNFNLDTNEDCSNFNDALTTGYGDKSTINTWWFANTTSVVRVNVPLVQGMISGLENVCPGQPTTWTASDAGATGNVTYSWTGPNNFTASTPEITIDQEGEYCVTIMDELGCMSTVCRTLTILDNGSGDFNYPETVDACLNEMVQLMPMGDPSGFTFQWSPSTGLDQDNIPNPTFTMTGNTVYTVEIQNIDNDCSFTETVVINQLTEPTPAFTFQSGCEQGLTINFINSSTDAVSYSWDFGDPNTNQDVSTAVNPSYTYPATGVYNVELTATSADGCIATITQAINVVTVPLIADFGVSYNNCDPNSVEVQFTDTSVNGAGNSLDYNWVFSGGFAPSTAENPVLTVTTAQTITATLTITTVDGCVASFSQNFDIQLGPPIDQFPAELIVCEGVPTPITPGGDPAYSYNWSPNIGINDITSPQPVFTPLVSTTYTVTITSSGADDCIVIEMVDVTIAPDINLEISGDGLTCNSNAQLVATTDVPAEIRWFDVDGNIVATGNTFSPLVSGMATYSAEAIDENGCMESSGPITVDGGSVDIDVPTPDAICLGEEIVLSVINLDANDQLTYLWTPAELFVPGTNTSATPDYIEVSGEINVNVLVTNQYGCNTVETVLVTVPPAIGLEVSGEGTFCTPTATLTASSAIPASFEWYDGPNLVNTGSEFIVPLSGTHTFTVIADDGTGCPTESQIVTVSGGPVDVDVPDPAAICLGEEIELNVTNLDDNDELTYLWTPAELFEPGTNTLPNPDYIEMSGEVTVNVQITSQFGCTTDEEVLIVVPPAIGLEVEGEGIFCTPTATLTASSAIPAVFEWYDGTDLVNTGPEFTVTLSGTHTFTVIANDGTGCPTESQEITVSGGPVNVNIPESVAICLGEEVLLSVTNLDPNDELTYLWTPAELFEPGTNTSATPNFIEGSGDFTVNVLVSNQFNCTLSQDVEVYVPPAIGLEITGAGTFCTPTATLTATTAIPATIEWYDENNELLNTGDMTTITLSGCHNIWAIADDGTGCPNDSQMVTVCGGPVDVMVPDTAAVCLGEQIQLSVINLDVNDELTYQWAPASLFVPGTETSATPDYIEAIGEQTVSVTVTSQFGCTTTEMVTVAVVDPNIDLSFTSEIDCNGGTVFFTNTSTDAFGYVWNFGDGTPLSYEENPVHTYMDDGVYTVTLDIVFDVSCAEAFSQDVMVEEPQIFADFTYDITDCSADEAVISFMDTSTNTLNNTIGWSWTFMNAEPATSSEQNPTVVVNNEGPLSVSLTITSANDCSNTYNEVLDIDLVDLDISLTDTIVLCLGDTTTLNPDGDPDLVYSWSPAEFLSDPTAASPQAFPPVTTTYTATAYSAVGSDTCFVTDQVVIFVPADINLELDQDPVVITCGEDVVITATADVDVNVDWISLIDGPIASNTSSITVNPFREDSIVAIATDMFGCVAMDTIVVIDNGVDIEILQGNDIIACQGVDTFLTVINLDDLDTLTYEWSPIENIIGSNTDDTVNIVINEVGVTTFTAIVTNQNACIDTIEVNVMIQEFDGELADTVYACYNEPTAINPGGNPDYVYNWSPETGLNLDDPSNPIATLTEDQLYMVTITDPVTGCSDQLEVMVIVYPDLALESEGGINLCLIEPIELTASTAISAELEWFFNAVSIGTGASITVTPPGEGCHTYTVVATDPETGCMQESEEVICVMEFMGVLPDDPVIVCADEPTPINPNGDPNLVYTWTPVDEFIDLTEPWNPIVTTNMPLTYFLTVMDTTFGCTALDTVNIEISPELNLDISPESVVLCDSIPTTLTANTDFPPANITWYLLPGDVEIGTGTEITFTPPGGENQVYAIATSAAGCTESDTINVNNVPIDANITDVLVICEATDAEVLEVVNNNTEQDLTILWESLGVLTPLDEFVVTVNPNITNDFSATVTNQYGCSETLSTTVTVVDLLNDLSITAEPDTILLGETSTITVSGCVGCSYEWDPPNADSPVFVFTPTNSEEVGLNEFFVTVDLLGCSLSLTESVFVIDNTCDADHVFFPNAFTPNRDGENDILRLRSSFIEELTEMELLIYNRWGEEMFRTTNQYDGWDGTYRNEDLAPDVYGYYLRVVCPNGDELIQKGNVTLLR